MAQDRSCISAGGGGADVIFWKKLKLKKWAVVGTGLDERPTDEPYFLVPSSQSMVGLPCLCKFHMDTQKNKQNQQFKSETIRQLVVSFLPSILASVIHSFIHSFTHSKASVQ